jgi:hypothetical protein
MLRALETLENVEYRFVAHSEVVDEGSATLVKLMADPSSATLIVNGCLFLNVASYRFLDFGRNAEERWEFILHGDASTLTLLHLPESEEADAAERRPRLLSEEEVPDFESLILLDEEDEDD